MPLLVDVTTAPPTPTSRPGIAVYWWDEPPQPSGAVRIDLVDEYTLTNVASALEQLAESIRYQAAKRSK